MAYGAQKCDGEHTARGLTRGPGPGRMEVQQGERERKETPMDIEIDFFEELGGYYTADLADVLEDFEG